MQGPEGSAVAQGKDIELRTGEIRTYALGSFSVRGDAGRKLRGKAVGGEESAGKVSVRILFAAMQAAGKGGGESVGGGEAAMETRFGGKFSRPGGKDAYTYLHYYSTWHVLGIMLVCPESHPHHKIQKFFTSGISSAPWARHYDQAAKTPGKAMERWELLFRGVWGGECVVRARKGALVPFLSPLVPSPFLSLLSLSLLDLHFIFLSLAVLGQYRPLFATAAHFCQLIASSVVSGHLQQFYLCFLASGVRSRDGIGKFDLIAYSPSSALQIRFKKTTGERLESKVFRTSPGLLISAPETWNPSQNIARRAKRRLHDSIAQVWSRSLGCRSRKRLRE
ncbi:hypothetical protein K439DRAFT_1625507, partial [Ramaria rubella]